MGAWGLKNFENDGSHDWLAEFGHEQRTRAALEAAFTTAIDSGDDYLEVDEGQAVLAAAEVLAAALGKRCSDFPDGAIEDLDWDEIRGWIDDALLSTAIKAIDRVTGDDSEIHELWAETEDLSEWLALVDDLRARLQR